MLAPNLQWGHCCDRDSLTLHMRITIISCYVCGMQSVRI